MSDREVERYRVAVLAAMPITPAVDGSRLRMLGLYGHLGARFSTVYHGTYNSPGPYQRVRLTETLEEIDVPLSADHFRALESLLTPEYRGRPVVETLGMFGDRSPDFVRSARDALEESDLVIFATPWVYPAVKADLRKRDQLIVYEAHTVGSYVRASRFDDGHLGTELLKHIVRVEHELCHVVDAILTCSHEDRQLFHELYGVPYHKVRVVPNGVFTQQIKPADAATRTAARKQLGLTDRPIVLFTGSNWLPNQEAARFICNTLAPAFPKVTFVILGHVGDEIDTADLRQQGITNVLLTGVVDDETLHVHLAAADLAINPLLSDSGSNVKSFVCMGAGLPLVATPVGARGLVRGAEQAFVVAPPSEFVRAVREVGTDPERMAELGAAARRLVETRHSWERISQQLGSLLHRLHSRLHQPSPFFSVLVATYERSDSLRTLLQHLHAQTFRDFEVVIVDQSAQPWDGLAEFPDLDILYVHTDVRGLARARNSAALLARGDVLAFTDDDCEPLPDWLERACPYFEDPSIVGVEGSILSGDRGDPAVRNLTNVDFEGFGFIGANLLLRRDTFYGIDGADEQFDEPNFREDTDLGWRALELGRIPFGRDVRVYHPPQPRSIVRESNGARVRAFEKDALLMKKHPERYRQLFLAEGHYFKTAGFREHFLRGAEKYGVQVDHEIACLLRSAGR